MFNGTYPSDPSSPFAGSHYLAGLVLPAKEKRVKSCYDLRLECETVGVLADLVARSLRFEQGILSAGAAAAPSSAGPSPPTCERTRRPHERTEARDDLAKLEPYEA